MVFKTIFLAQSGFFSGLIGFLGVVGMCFLVYFLISLLSKATNTTVVSRSGSTITTPETYDQIINSAKEKSAYLKTKISNFDISSWKRISNNDVDVIQKLEELDRLKTKGIIDEEEFQYIKKALIRKNGF